MKKISLLASLLVNTMALSACGGGSSDSSGSNNTTSATPAPTNPAPANPAPTNPAPNNVCEINGTNVYATKNGCTYSNQAVNKGENITYTCTADNRVQSATDISAKTITFNGTTIMCKP